MKEQTVKLSRQIIDAIFKVLGYSEKHHDKNPHVRIDDKYEIWKTLNCWYLMDRESKDKRVVTITGHNEIGRIIQLYLSLYDF